MSNFTPEDLISYHYNEMTLADRERMQEALAGNWPLLEKYKILQKASKSLDKAIISPRKDVVQTILDYGMEEINTSKQI